MKRNLEATEIVAQDLGLVAGGSNLHSFNITECNETAPKHRDSAFNFLHQYEGTIQRYSSQEALDVRKKIDQFLLPLVGRSWKCEATL